MNDEFDAGAAPGPSGARFRVWAPEHARLELVLYDSDGAQESRTVPMAKEHDGHFAVTVPGLAAGALYKFRVDGAGPFPDPRSRAQPLGVHGPSQLVDPTAFAWTDDAWRGVPLDALVLYEVHVGTATPEGTFDALAERVGELRALGITALELMPVASFPGRRNWGYDGVDLFAPAAVYGGPEGLRRLVDRAHREGLAVLLDVVYNHLGPDGNYLRAFSPRYFTAEHHTPWGDAVNLREPAVRAFFRANAAHWIREYHLDGLRLDATHALLDDTPEHLLAEIARAARDAAPGRAVLVTAEDERNDARLVRPAARGGYGLDAVWADDFHHALRRALAGDREGYYRDYEGSAREVARALERGWLYEGQRSLHFGRERGTPADEVPPPRLIHCVQNHDQVGNRARGDRLGASVSPSAYRAASALLLLSPYTPLLFMGQEWNATTPFQYFTDHHAELGRLVTEGRRREFEAFATFAGLEVPDPQADATFEASRLEWRERERPGHAGVLAWYRALLALRAQHPALRARGRGSFTAWAPSERAVALERRGAGARVLVLANLGGALEHALDAGDAWEPLAFSEEARFGGAGSLAAVVREGVVRWEGPGALVLKTR